MTKTVNASDSFIIDNLPSIKHLGDNMRWQVVPSMLEGHTKVKLQRKRWFFWHTLADTVTPTKNLYKHGIGGCEWVGDYVLRQYATPAIPNPSLNIYK